MQRRVGASPSSRCSHQRKVLGGQFVETVGQVLVEAGQVLNLHLDPVVPEGVVPLQLISEETQQHFVLTPAVVLTPSVCGNTIFLC